ncbi:hypothetical protein [Streptomyces sp. NPDC058861]|uniref:hypothetical protein n=1 Tax=Streptomyces sp. NPDC058861 TaxID=3346653 RepID=UPI0036CE1062
MLATAELVRSSDPKKTETVWHRPTDPDACDGNCDYHTVACGEPGISLPGGIRDVPEDLNEPGQRWCADCRIEQNPDESQEPAA